MMNSFYKNSLTTLDILNFLEEELKDTYFDSSETRYLDEKLIHDGRKSLSVFFRNAYSKPIYYQDTGVRELPIVIHLLSDAKANRSHFQQIVIDLEHMLRTYSIFNDAPIVNGRKIKFLKDFRSVLNIGENEYGQSHYSIDIVVAYRI